MARQGRSGAGSRPSRPTVAPRAAPAPQRQQTRPSSTAAAPANAQHAAPPPAAAAAPAGAAAPSQGPGLFANMASTAAGVAVGSSIGHAIGGFFGGGSAPAAAPEAQVANAQAAPEQNNWQARNCDVDAKQFTKCLDENQGNMQTCSWYLEQLKACQAAASNY